uniref:Uncharacterized protein n=1 Tax=Panagrolaimus davidi TaxID=227884 RepID=A0A914RAZ2_9BILA
MKFSLSFLVLVAVIKFGFSNVLSKRDVQELLLSDNYEIAVQNGSDIKMVKPGPLDVILAVGNELAFKVCSIFLVCYEPDSSGQNVLESCDTKCGFYITTLGDKISFMEPVTSKHLGVVKSDQCFEVKMKNGETSVLSLTHQAVASPITCAPKIQNGIVKLNIINATSDCVVSIKNAIIKHETTTVPPATTTLGKLDRTSSGENEHASAATTDEPESFFADYWWIILILLLIVIIAIGVGVGLYCYLRRKKNAQKPVPVRRQRLQGSKSPFVLQASTENQNGTNESAVRPNSLYNQSSILSHKSLLKSKKDEAKKAEPESTDLTSMKPTA